MPSYLLSIYWEGICIIAIEFTLHTSIIGIALLMPIISIQFVPKL